MKRLLLTLIIFTICLTAAHSQNGCNAKGKNPTLAIPLCATSAYKQDSVSICSGKEIPVPVCNGGAAFTDKNPFWYKFTCYKAKPFEFTIVPKVQNEDYDWQLFDITGRNPNDVYTDASLFVTCNWSGSFGNTGTSINSNLPYVCEGNAGPPISAAPILKVGHNYLLMISHFTDTQFGYEISFSGDISAFVDTSKPRVISARALCNGNTVELIMNKKVLCNSLTSNASEFQLQPNAAAIQSVTTNCNGGFDFDTALITFSSPIPPGNYFLVSKIGTDRNTVQDVCNNFLPDKDSTPLVVYVFNPTTIDSIIPITNCEPSFIDIHCSRNVNCNSIAANGSDFLVKDVQGNSLPIQSAKGICTKSLTNTIRINFNQPIFNRNNYTVSLQKGTDGNSLIDECGIELTLPQQLNFYVKQAVKAKAQVTYKKNCLYDSLYMIADTSNEIKRISWQLPNGTIIKNDTVSYRLDTVANYRFTLNVANSECFDDSVYVFSFKPKAYQSKFEVTQYVCPLDKANFINLSTGNIALNKWDLGNGNTSTLQTPLPQQYISNFGTKDFTIQLIIQDTSNGVLCYDTSYQIVKAVPGCLIAVPSAFTPNNDGLNDYLYPLNAYKAQQLIFKVYNRYGQLVFETKNWQNKWDGTVNGVKEDAGIYVWFLEYIEADTGKKVSQKGTTVLIR